MSTMPACYEASLSADPFSASSARNFVRLHLVEHGLDHLVEDARLVASELATNAVRHAPSVFTIMLEIGEALVVLTVGDASRRAPLRAVGDLMDVGGRGLVLVEHLSDAWGVNAGPDGGKSVWASFATAAAASSSR